MLTRLTLIFLLLSSTCLKIEAQRFSLLAEVGGMKSQIDGDKIAGFFYNGYIVGIGTNYTINKSNFIAVKTSYYSQGSRKASSADPPAKGTVQLELGFNTIGLELGYKYDPVNRPFFLGVGVIRHQVVSLEYEAIQDLGLFGEPFVLQGDELESSYLSLKFFYGRNLFERADAYLAFEGAVTDLMKARQVPFHTIIPYSISAVFSYQIIVPNFQEKQKRAGRKSREEDWY